MQEPTIPTISDGNPIAPPLSSPYLPWQVLTMAAVMVVGWIVSFATGGLGILLMVAVFGFASYKDWPEVKTMRGVVQTYLSPSGQMWYVIGYVMLFPIFCSIYVVRLVLEMYKPGSIKPRGLITPLSQSVAPANQSTPTYAIPLATSVASILRGPMSRELSQILMPGEEVLASHRGRINQVMVATSMRVINIKKGLATGGVFGTNSSTYSYSQLTSVDVRKGLLDGYIELTAGGVNQRRSRTRVDSMTGENTMQFSRMNTQYAYNLVKVIRSKIVEAHNSPQMVVAPVTLSPPLGPTIADQIQQLAQLRDNGILTEAEFSTKKAELLSRI